jgi:hypothetical protein
MQLTDTPVLQGSWLKPKVAGDAGLSVLPLERLSGARREGYDCHREFCCY